MVYKWRIPGIVPVDAQTAGEELERIYKRDGIITPEKVLEDNTETGTPLHNCFEWDNTAAAHKYRVKQAKEIIQTIIFVPDSVPQSPPVRAFVSVSKDFHPISVVLDDDSMKESLLSCAVSELKAFQRKYQTLSELAGVFKEIDALDESRGVKAK